jgi:antitoxin component YwqK of YwqJK toxin-antitoxin module
MKRYIFLLSIFLISQQNISFSQETVNPDTINQTDEQGRKQGFWTKRYPNGNTAYEAYFTDNKPVGTLKRFHENGKKMAILKYNQQGSASVTFYSQSGKKSSTGFYTRKKKDSTWLYFDNEENIILKEKYDNGEKDGISETYYKNGVIAESIKWKNGQPHGLWTKYYNSGEKMLETKYIDGQLNGLFYLFHKNGQVDIKGHYKDDVMVGQWQFFDEKGNFKKSVEYINGKPKQKELLDSVENQRLLELEKNKGKFLDPENFKGNPYEYMRKSR